MEVRVVKDNGNEYFVCPNCEKTIILSWDYNNHSVDYTEQCKECGQKLIWDKQLIDLKTR